MIKRIILCSNLLNRSPEGARAFSTSDLSPSHSLRPTDYFPEADFAGPLSEGQSKQTIQQRLALTDCWGLMNNQRQVRDLLVVPKEQR